MRVHHAFKEPSGSSFIYDGLTSCGRDSKGLKLNSSPTRVSCQKCIARIKEIYGSK